MESLVNKIKGINSSKSENVETAQQTNSNITRVKSFSDYGHLQSGLNRGDATSLKTFLSWIKDGFVVDENYNEQETNEKRKSLESSIEDKKDEKQKVIADKKVIEQVQIPNKKQDRTNLNNSISDIQNELDNEMLETGFQSTNYYLYTGLTIVLSVYLIFFYASTIYSAFFRSAGLLVETSGDDLAMVIGSIFDMNGILNPSPNLIIVYLGSFLFFALGVIPHTIKGAYKTLKIVFFLLGTLIVDALLAYKIDKSIHEIKVMAGIGEENWDFWASENFYLVLAFGYLAYLVFGYMYQLMNEEKTKKNPKKIAQRNINLIKEEIKEVNLTINKYEEQIVELQSKVEMLESRIELLMKSLNDTMINPEVLSKSLNSFYIGWRQFLNGSSEIGIEKGECENVYKTFMEENFKTIPSLN
jgi:Flp pilus assembly protein TadB